jgi:hypothetical protein
MGFFSRKTIISVSSVVYPMGEDPEKVPDMVKSSVIAAALRRQSIPPAINTCIYDGMGVKFAQAWSYARQNYYAGLPTGLPKAKPSKDDRMLDLLCKEYLEQFWAPDIITLHNAAVEYTDDYQTKFEELVAAEYNYDFTLDNTLSATGSIQNGAILTYVGPTKDFEFHETEIGYVLTFTNPDTSTVVVNKWYPEADFDGYEVKQNRVIINYSRNGGRSVRESYEQGGMSNRLNIMLRDLDHPTSGTFPCIVIKKNNVYLNDNKFTGTDWHTSSAYKTSKTYGKRMGINVDDVIKLVKSNASDKDIDYVFVQPGIRLGSHNQPVVEYLYNYFNRLRVINDDGKPAFDSWVAANNYATNGHHVVPKQRATSCPAQSIHIYDPDAQSNTLDMEIAWRYINYSEKSGTLASPWVIECGDYEEVMAKYPLSRVQAEEKYETTKLYIRKRLTSVTYAEIVVCGLRHENYIYKGHSVQSGCWAAFNDIDSDDGSGFMIPLDYTVFITLSARERLQLSQEAMHIVFNCYVARKQKWYETGWFKLVLFIIMIVVIVLTWGTATPYVTGAYTSITAALIAAGISATLAAALAMLIVAVIMVAISMAISFVAKEVGKWAADHWGPAWGALVQMIAVIALSYGVGQLGQLGGAFSSLSAFSMSNSVLQVGQALLAGMAAYTQYTYEALQDEIKDWSDITQTKNNPLAQVNKLIQEMFPELTDIQMAALPRPESEEEFLGRTLTTTDGLTSRLFLPINNMVELTLTPRL